MKAAGYEYVVIDGGWEGYHDAQGLFRPNKLKFPDMKALCDYIHGLGLKVGIHTTRVRHRPPSHLLALQPCPVRAQENNRRRLVTSGAQMNLASVGARASFSYCHLPSQGDVDLGDLGK